MGVEGNSASLQVGAYQYGLLQWSWHISIVGSDETVSHNSLVFVVNVAILPGGTTVSINTVNVNSNSQYYRGATPAVPAAISTMEVRALRFDRTTTLSKFYSDGLRHLQTRQKVG